jgi:PT repeat
MTRYYWLFAIVELLLRRGSCALTYNQTTAVVLCDMITSLPRLKTLKVPWSCPDASAIKSITWCTQRWTGINCNTKKLVISLTLGNQSLVGSIPRTIGLLTSLNKYLWINYNHISGSIPTSIGNLTSLTSIRFDHNSLSGTVPRTLTRLSKLKTLNVNDNYLTGSLPTLSQVTYNDDEGSSVTTFTQLTHYPTSQPTSQPSGQPTSQPSKQKVLPISTCQRFVNGHPLIFLNPCSGSTLYQTHWPTV